MENTTINSNNNTNSSNINIVGGDENKVHKIIDEIISNNKNGGSSGVGGNGNGTDTNNPMNTAANMNSTMNGMMSEEDDRFNDNESIYKSKIDNHIKCQFMDGSTRIIVRSFIQKNLKH
jgi:hypothetical protein